MKNCLLVTLALTFCVYALPAKSEILWDNPAVLCPEEILPRGLACPNLSGVENPYINFPPELTVEEITDWKNNKAADLNLCRSTEVLRRERAKPGSYSAGGIEIAWMVVDGSKNVQEKLNAVKAASLKYGIPPQVLIGAMKQESLLSSLGIAPDGGNFSCGIAQLNIQEWCQSMNGLSDEKKTELGWPNISCDGDDLPTDIVKPFYDIAIKNAGDRPNYELTSEDFKGITYKDINKKKNIFDIFSKSKITKKNFNAVMSFVNNCQNITLSVSAKAQTLKSLFDNFVPKSLKNAELYTDGKTFPRSCVDNYPTSAYPLHTGWLLAVAMYNAGPMQAKILKYYYQVQDNNFPAINPLGLIEALHWGGKWQEGTDNIAITGQSGDLLSQRWFKSCIVQRHVAKVIQHVTLPAESIAKSLEQEKCKMTGVPEYRKTSSGIKGN